MHLPFDIKGRELRCAFTYHLVNNGGEDEVEDKVEDKVKEDIRHKTQDTRHKTEGRAVRFYFLKRIK